MNHPDYEVAIVGSGFSGLCMAIQLVRKTTRSFILLEKADAIGGTWRDNHYPGCACDVPAHLYSFSFAPNPDWSQAFAPHHEIREYLERCVDRFGIRSRIQTGSEITAARFDADQAMWTIEVGGASTITARHLVLGTGPLSRPSYPDIEGLDRFAGAAFHSACWDHSFDLTNRRVAVIGTGASAIQLVPQIAPEVASLSLFQRTAPWVLPRPDRHFGPKIRRLFRLAPALQRAYRWWLYWTMELRAFGFTVDPRIMKIAARWGEQHLERTIADVELRRKLTPDYVPGCKRILMANDYYPALARPNVEVITDPIARVTEDAIETAAGQRHQVDAIVYATGFAVTDLLGTLSVTGRTGQRLEDVWSENIEAYLGTQVHGFPNLFFLLGPNTGLGHNSMVFMIEAQVHYAMKCIDAAGTGSIEVRAAPQRTFNEDLRPRLARSVWATGCQSWYLDPDGRNVTVWPSFTAEYWLRTRRVVTAHMELRAGDEISGLGRTHPVELGLVDQDSELGREAG